MRLDKKTLDIYRRFVEAHEWAKDFWGKDFAGKMAGHIALIEDATAKHRIDDLEACHQLIRHVRENDSLDEHTKDVTTLWLMAALVEKFERETVK